MEDEAQLAEKRLRESGLEVKITSGDDYEVYHPQYDKSDFHFITASSFDPEYDENRPEEERLIYPAGDISTAREFLKSTKYCGLEIIIDDMVNWEVIAILKEKFNSGEEWTKLEQIINSVAIFYMGGVGPVDISSDPSYIRAKQELDNKIEALFIEFGHVEKTNYIKFVNLMLDNFIKSEPKVLVFRAQLMEYAMNTFESIKASDKYMQSLQKRGRDVINELFKSSNMWVLDDLANFLVREFGYDYSDTLRNLEQMVLSKEPVSFEFLAGLFQDVMHASRFHRIDIDTDKFISVIEAYNPLFSLFLERYNQDPYRARIFSYLLNYEKNFQEYYEVNQELYENIQEAYNAGEMTQEEYKNAIEEMNQYSTGREASWSSVFDLQTNLLLELWDGRDALTGRVLVDKNGEYPPYSIIRHHYEIIGWDGRDPIFIKFDCRLVAQVPLSTESHGIVKATIDNDPKEHADNFKRVMEKLMRGEWATPGWWSEIPGGNDRLASFEQNLIILGYIRPSNLAR